MNQSNQATVPALEAVNVSYETSGGQRLLSDVSLTIQPGEVVVLVGPNGAGKSTLLNVLVGDLPPTSGRVALHGEPIERIPAQQLALRRAVLPQQTMLQFAFTAREVVEMGRAPHEQPRGWRQRFATADPDHDDIVTSAMDRTETTGLADRIFPTLSGGEQSRVSLARVLAQQTPVLLLDEPTAALDLRHQQLVMEVARELARDGAAVLAILHDLNLAASYADRLAILCHGRIRAIAEPWTALNEHVLSDVFQCPIAIAQHPVRGCPLVIPLPNHDAAADRNRAPV